jgi:hypothetical protein
MSYRWTIPVLESRRTRVVQNSVIGQFQNAVLTMDISTRLLLEWTCFGDSAQVRDHTRKHASTGETFQLIVTYATLGWRDSARKPSIASREPSRYRRQLIRRDRLQLPDRIARSVATIPLGSSSGQYSRFAFYVYAKKVPAGEAYARSHRLLDQWSNGAIATED